MNSNKKGRRRTVPAFFILIILFFSVFQSGCSTTSWVVVSEEETDREDYQLLGTRYYFESQGMVTPESPVLDVQLKAINTYEYTQRIKTERYVQQYKPRLGYVLAGAAGAGLSYYAAFSDNLIKAPSNPQKYALAGTGSALFMLSFINMEPVGEPVQTGESRLLRKTGSVTEIDTTNAAAYNDSVAPMLTITYNGSTLVQDSREFDQGKVSINLVDEINAENLDPNSEEPISVYIEYDDLTYSRDVPVSSVFEKFSVVSARITALRNSPEIEANNVLTDLGQGSQLKLVSEEGEWSKVLYGISENWVLSSDVYTILRPSEFASDLSVITVTNVPFGSVDVEDNIPRKHTPSFNSAAFILANYQYDGALSERIYADRDARLIKEYINLTLGVRERKIIQGENIGTEDQFARLTNRLLNAVSVSDSSLTIYISGYAELQDGIIYYLGSSETEGQPERLDLHRFFEKVNELDLNKLVVFADLDFLSQEENQAAMNDLAEKVTQKIPDSAIIFSANPDQRSGLYSSSNGEQNRHSIFTYYLAEALKEGNRTLRSIYNHLERNVSFTSRRLYDRPQNISIFGNPDIRLAE